MGYLTEYTLSTVEDISPGEKRNICRSISYGIDFGWNDACKWYNWNRDMLEVSLQFPRLTFILEGQGEESDDQWIAYFKNGKSVKYMAEIRFPEFNEQDMK